MFNLSPMAVEAPTAFSVMASTTVLHHAESGIGGMECMAIIAVGLIVLSILGKRMRGNLLSQKPRPYGRTGRKWRRPTFVACVADTFGADCPRCFPGAIGFD